jgi:hypothetical protein
MFKKLWTNIKNALWILFIQVPKSFFFAEGEFKAALFWITFFCSCAAIMTVQTIFSFKTYDITLLLGIWGFLLGWIGIYNTYKNSSNKIENVQLKQNVELLTKKLNIQRGK